MKKLFLLTGLLMILVIVFTYVNKTKEITFQESSAASQEEERNETTWDNVKYLYAVSEVGNIENIKLISNFENKARSQTVFTDNKCRLLVNAGFYTEGAEPIGLFISERKLINKWAKNTLFDGVISINDYLIPRISRVVPKDNLFIAVQSGPIVKENGESVRLRIKNDKQERRVVAGVSGENKLYFIVIYSETQNFSGPLLANVPEIINMIEKRENIILADAVNLDGGTASVFMTNKINLSELTPVGSYFCEVTD